MQQARIAGRPPALARSALLLLALLAGIAAAAAAAPRGSVDVSSCQSAVWSGLPLARDDVPSQQYKPASRAYYSEWVLKNVIPPFVFACIAATLLLVFLLWRIATCTPCLRGPRLRGKPAAALLGARCMRWLRWGAATLALGMVAGAGYGFSTIQPALEPRGIQVYEEAKAYVASCLMQANSTLGAVEAIEGQAAFLQQRVLDLSLEEHQPGLLETVEGFHSDIQSAAAGMQGSIADVQHTVLGRMEELQQEWQPRLDKLDVVKNAALYAAYVLIIAAALAVALGVFLSCPGLVKGSLVLLLTMLLLAWVAVSASTVGLQVGSNGCAVVEQKITDALVQAAERQIRTGEGILALVGVGDTLSLARYYFTGQGKNASEVLSDLTGLNIPRLLAAANRTAAQLHQASVMLEGATNSTAIRTLPKNLDALASSIAQLSGNVSQLEAMVSYQSFSPQYLSMKKYGCCEVLNFLGGLWLGLLVVGCFGLLLTLTVFVWLGRMDKLEPRSCCHMYRRSDYLRPAGLGVAQLADKGPDCDSEDEFSPRRSLAGSISLRQKFAAAGLLWHSGGPGAGPAAAQQPDGADSFRIRTAPYPGTPDHDPEQPDLQLAHVSPPSAPALPPMSARSLQSSRAGAGSSSHQLGTWAAAGAGAGAGAGAPASARGAAANRSAPGSTLNSARSTHSASGLLPAVEALSLPAQAALPARATSPALLDGSLAQEQEQASSASAAVEGGSTSAFKRAGNAIARLKLLRRR